MEEYVVLVDNQDNRVGLMEKMEAHLNPTLHRAFSIFIFNSKHEMLLQRRALTKYHTPGLWTNTCCSHPRDGETLEDATKRRLMEEMGMECELRELFSFVYKADVMQGLTEYEFDHVFVGTTDVIPIINKEEVDSYRYASIDEIKSEIEKNPDNFTVWFKIAFEKLREIADKLLAISH